MCTHCTDPNHEAPTHSDLTAGDAELFDHDRKHPHDPWTCQIRGCWVCGMWHFADKAEIDERAERRTA